MATSFDDDDRSWTEPGCLSSDADRRLLSSPPPAPVGKLVRRIGLALVQVRMFGAPPPTLGRYEIQARIGEGGMGTVFRARDPLLERPLAIKVLHRHDRQDRALSEARALARLSHPHVLSLFDVGFEEDQLWLATELVVGGTLRDWLTSHGGRRWRETLSRFVEAAQGLAAAHRAGVIHRDFKPDNVLVSRDGSLRVADFGLASGSYEMPSSPGSGPRASAREGTPRYWAPEVDAGEAATAQSDQYSFFVSLREALRRTDLEASPDIHTALGEFVERGCHPDPTQRHPSMAVVARALAEIVERRPLTPPRAVTTWQAPPIITTRILPPSTSDVLEMAREIDGPTAYRAAVLEWINRHIGFDTALLGQPEATLPECVRIENFDEQFIARFRGDPMRFAGPLMRLSLMSAAERGPVRDVDVFGLDERGKLPFYNELIGPKGSKVMLVSSLMFRGMPVGSLQISRGGRGASFSDRELRSIRQVLEALAEGEHTHDGT